MTSNPTYPDNTQGFVMQFKNFLTGRFSKAIYTVSIQVPRTRIPEASAAKSSCSFLTLAGPLVKILNIFIFCETSKPPFPDRHSFYHFETLNEIFHSHSKMECTSMGYF